MTKAKEGSLFGAAMVLLLVLAGACAGERGPAGDEGPEGPNGGGMLPDAPVVFDYGTPPGGPFIYSPTGSSLDTLHGESLTVTTRSLWSVTFILPNIVGWTVDPSTTNNDLFQAAVVGSNATMLQASRFSFYTGSAGTTSNPGQIGGSGYYVLDPGVYSLELEAQISAQTSIQAYNSVHVAAVQVGIVP